MRLREETRKVDKTGLIQVDGRHYRVPDEYSQKDVQILMNDHSIHFCPNRKAVRLGSWQCEELREIKGGGDM